MEDVHKVYWVFACDGKPRREEERESKSPPGKKKETVAPS